MNPNSINEDVRLDEINEAKYEDSYIAPPPSMAEPAQETIDPDNPPWGVGAGLLTWLASALFLLIFQILFVAPYFVANKGLITKPEEMMTSPIAIFLIVISIIPAHLSTIWLVWMIVTGWHRRPFRETLGWDWSKNVGFWTSVGLAVLLLGLGIAITHLAGGGETDIDKIIKASLPARFALAFIAAFTAPLTEELVYRGVLYSGLRKSLRRFIPGGDQKVSTVLSVVFVSILFALVHVPQYINNIGVIFVIMILSIALTVIRAKTGKLLPCIMIHFIFNGIQAIFIVFGAFLGKDNSDPTTQQTGITLENFLRLLF